MEATLAEALPSRGHRVEMVARRALHILPPFLLVAAAWVLWREFHHLSFEAVGRSMGRWGAGRIVAATALSVVSFVLMGVIEWFGLRWTGARVPWWPALWGSSVANAIAHSIGANLLVSGAVRARLYERYGVGLTQVAGATLFAGFSFAVGISALSGGGLLLASPADLAATAIPLTMARALAGLLLMFVAAYVLACGLLRRPLTAFGRSLSLPTARDAMVQIAVGVADNATAAAIIWVLLPPHAVGFGGFVGAYAVACVAGLVSSIPGGAGVFESAIAALLTGIGKAPLAAAFLGYRLVYYIGPLILGALALAADAVRTRRPRES